MAKTPANATKATPAKIGAAAPKTTAPKAEAASNAAPATADADAAGSTLKDAEITTAAAADKAIADAAADQLAPIANAIEAAALTGTASTSSADQLDIEAIKKEAYDKGFTDGFNDALDGQADTTAVAQDRADLDQVEQGEGFASSSTAYRRSYREQLIALALFTPENQRKGGMVVVVDRLESFLDTLDPEDQAPALSFMYAIAQTNPIDLASGRFRLVVKEALLALNGAEQASIENDANQTGESAAARMAEAMPDLDSKPEELREQEEDELAGVDLKDADDAGSAAARMRGLLG